MFGIGGQELILILVLALIIIGPKKLPDIAKTLGKAMGEFQRATDDLKKEMNHATDLSPSRPSEKKPVENEPEQKEHDPVEDESEKKPSEDAAAYNPDEIEG